MHILLLCYMASHTAVAANWFLQTHHTTSTCATPAFSEFAGNSGNIACTSSAPCSLAAGSPPQDYLLTSCTGTSPAITISSANNGLVVWTYSSSNLNAPPCAASDLTSVSAFRLNTCYSLSTSPSTSFKYVCDSTGVAGSHKLQYSDSNCTAYTGNSTLLARGSVASGVCGYQGLNTFRYECPVSSGAMKLAQGAIFIALLLAFCIL